MGPDAAYSIKKADIHDIDEIIDICKNCFPFSFQCHAPGFLLRKKWLTTLESGCVEVYMIKINSEAACFYELIVDIPAFEKNKWKNIPDQILSFLYVVFAHPRCIVPAVRKLIKEARYVKPDWQTSKLENNIDISKIAWGELQGVHRNYRGKGLSKIMQKHILNRCVELDKEIIGCINDPHNIPVMNLHKSFGYFVSSENKYGCVLKKELPRAEKTA
jgi:hypothetical protein